MANTGTYLKIDLKAVAHNYHFIRSRVHENTKVLGVIKAFAYGHEAVAIAKKLETLGINYFAVAYVPEGIALRKAGITSPILVLHPQLNDAIDCVNYQLEPNIYSFKILRSFTDKLSSLENQFLPIHLKFNTGLNRLGFKISDIDALFDELIKHKTQCKVQSVFSHLVASEDINEKSFTEYQIKQYQEIISIISKKIDYPFIKHIANTSGTLNYPEAHFDMVRTGIGLYGYGNSAEYNALLKNVGSLYSVITQIHTIEKGESVGYNRAFRADKTTRTATIPLGHADGIPRTWGKGKGFVQINGEIATLLGNVCMDMIMVDVTDIECSEGDTVIVFDNQPTVENIAERVGTISYELLTAISQRVPRLIVE